MANAAEVRNKVPKESKMDAQVLATLTDEALTTALTRPGVYKGNHYFDLGDSLLWRSGDQGEECGEPKWFYPAKKPGDKAERSGQCPSGLDWYTITLVA